MINQLPIDNGYQSSQEIFTFRDVGSIRIPKSVREVAMMLEIDVEVVSFSSPQYINYKSYPSHGFYGYAVLVFSNYATKLIPIQFGRNTLYWERIDCAYSNWESYKYLHWTSYNLGLLSQSICVIAEELGGVCLEQDCETIPWNGFPEIPLREVYVRCPKGTTFRIEAYYEKALQFQNACGTLISPLSQRADDPEKDNGLPPFGIQPQVPLDPNFPYAGFPPPSTPEEQGDFYNPKIPVEGFPNSGLDHPNPDNEPDLSSTIYWIKIVARAKQQDFPYGCNGVRVQTLYFQLLDNTVSWTTINTDVGSDTCGGRRVQVAVILSGGDGTPLTAPNTSNGDCTITKESGTALPANTLIHIPL